MHSGSSPRVRGPTERAPLILIINEDMVALREFRQALTKRNTEQDVQRTRSAGSPLDGPRRAPHSAKL
jgi:hypothetical protein